jgi:CRISPR/Cas system-associated exonuclease Cas4 (RecB family)
MTRKIPKKAYKEKEKRNKRKQDQTELVLPSIPKISQSLCKSLYKYKMGNECGILIEESYINKVNFPSSEAQELGNYFEYKATGQLPRDGHTPEAKTLKNGKPTLPYQRMDKQVENFKHLMKRLNFEVEQTGFAFNNPKYSGITDIIAIDKKIKSKDIYKKRIIIDLKSSGLINDKWTEYGWADESIEEKDELLIQAIHYKMLANYEWGIEDIPFYFMVFSTKNDWEYKVFRVNVDEATYKQHYNNLINIKSYLDQQLKIGFKPKPSLSKCNSCSLNLTCLHSADIPKIQDVYI